MQVWQSGIDVGGTNTDVLLVDAASGEFKLAKVPSDVTDQSKGVIAGLIEAGVPFAELGSIVHGTTVATNAVLERKGARCGMITTRGFRDSLELGRRTRPYTYGMNGSFKPVIDRELRMEVDERVGARGEVQIELDEQQVRDALKRLIELGAESVLIHFLHSYINPAHEERATEIAREIWPNEYITTGSRVLREVREFERGSTGAVNAFVQPTLSRYLGRLSDQLEDRGFPHQLLIMQGNGGTIAAGLAMQSPVQTVMSGPAAGAIAAAHIGRSAGIPNLIACDMGGTSFDVSLIREGEPAVSAEKDIAYSVPVRVPMVDVHTIGAGGGSIAYVDVGGMLRVGPESAGATPGPVCYGRGGTRPTVTDANAMLGRIDPGSLSGVKGPSGLKVVEEALLEHVGRPLGFDAHQAAAAILQVAGNHLASAIRLVSIEQGHDPRDFALFAFGGAGSLHAVSLARELGVPRVLVPRFPGITSALGCVLADVRHDFVHTLWTPLADVDPKEAQSILKAHDEEGRGRIADDRVPVTGIEVVHEVDLLYRGQTHVFRVTLPTSAFDGAEVAAALSEVYKARFDIELKDMTPVLANLRTVVVGRRQSISLDVFGSAPSARGAIEPIGRRPVYFGGAFVDTPIYSRDHLSEGSVIEGPAIVQQIDATTVMDPDSKGRTDRLGNLVIDVF